MHKKIKILFIMDYYYSNFGGTEGQIYNLINNLDKDVFEIELCLMRDFADHKTDMRLEFPCKVFCLELKKVLSFYGLMRFFKLRSYIKKHSFDIVQSIFNDAAIITPIILIGLNVTVISTRRDMGFWYTPFVLRLLKITRFFTDKFLVNSFAVMNNIIEKENIHSSKIEVIYNAHNINRFLEKKNKKMLKKLKIPDKSKIIGIVANHRPVKRIKDLVLAFTEVLKRNPDCYLIWVGDQYGAQKEYVELADSLGIASNVRFIGKNKNVVPIIKCFSVGVNCSLSEGLSNVLIEYMGCGVPIVASDVPGNSELINHGRNGLLFPVGNPAALAEEIICLLNNDKLQNYMRANSEQFVKDNFNEKTIINKYDQFYSQLVSKKI